MNSRIAAVAVLALMLGCSGTDEPEPAEPACDPTDADDQAYDAWLAGLDLSQGPAEIPFSNLQRFDRSSIAYMLGLHPDDLGDSRPRDDLAARSHMGRAVLAAAHETGTIDVLRLREGLRRYYNCVGGFPATLDEFRATIFDYTSTPGTLLQSEPKVGSRLLFESLEERIFVAETRVDGEVRETEVLLSNRTDGAFDFVAYDHDGRITRISSFANALGETSTIESPLECMVCHIDPEVGTFTVPEPREDDR